MSTEINNFRRTLSSLDTSMFVGGGALGAGAIWAFIHKAYILGIVFFLFFIYNLYSYSKIPSNISIDNMGVQCGQELFRWDEIEQVLFTVNRGKNYEDTQIILCFDNSNPDGVYPLSHVSLVVVLDE